MKERPILFSGPMVRALLAGTKKQTRRLVKPQPEYRHGFWLHGGLPIVDFTRIPCPYGNPADRLWVKETFSAQGSFSESGRCLYRADLGDAEKEPHGEKWKPSIFCSRKASRITLEITGVRVERLNDLSEADALAEGVAPWFGDIGAVSARDQYACLWDTLNAKRGFGWASNPWVWVIEFKKL